MTHPRLVRRIRLAAGLVALPILAGCLPQLDALTAPSSTDTTAPGSSAADVTAARKALESLPERVEDTGAHYDRDAWGEWAYDRATKCNTRERVLARDGRDLVVDTKCRPTCPSGGCWTSPYDGTTVSDAADLQIDHIVPLAEAQRSGARSWSGDQRVEFYNDLDNLVAVTARSNQSKSDDDPGRWKPTAAHRCDYAVRYITVKARYALHADQAERAALAAMLRTC